MNAVARQRRANARRIAQAPAAPEAPDRPAAGLALVVPAAPAAVSSTVAQDRADAVSGSPVQIDLLADGMDARAVVALAGQPVHGHVVLSDDSTAVYTSAPGFTGTDVFGYRLADGRGRVSRVTVTVSVAPHAGSASGWGALAYAA
ncbi:hypothetical protein GXW83_08905 [Streptacidiphilus sp. PB12-B1b]|uniref:Ig-like domain-containing protein n=1 Tax=Streptacidiphilus sp. PB12-B1b TaxID=2705012 RepID=UPI0015F88689|nr:Ig-like domain-containing protein [Streptacidiphilus sp. PB12-B1b]QMU75843.1 hypothetical protein GXW83_08905 [Streptacidiphilus sp. PB12-B1b]